MPKVSRAELSKRANAILTAAGTKHHHRNSKRGYRPGASRSKIDRVTHGLLIKEAYQAAETQLLAESATARAERDAAERQSVYVIGSAGFPIKIGIAADVNQRCKDLQTASPIRLRVYYHEEAFGGLARSVERECHRRLYEYRLSGEWFDFDPYEAAELVKRLVAELR